ncbi:MAG: serine hydrolase [Planctomycetota bacterium]|jgi:beta-lactamase class A
MIASRNLNSFLVVTAVLSLFLFPSAAAMDLSHHKEDMTLFQLLIQNGLEQSMNPKFGIMDLEVRWDGIQERYSGVWSPVNGTLYWALQVNAQGWDDFLNQMKSKNGRWLDVEVGYFGFKGKRWTGIFLEDGDDYGFEIRTTNTDAQFQTRLDENLREGRQIIDFEAYTVNNDMQTIRYGGVWVSDPNQPRTHLYYGLQSDEVDDMVVPLAGRIIDYERYWSPLHNEYRHALIVIAWPGPVNEWALWYGQTKSQFNNKNDAIQAQGINLIDLEIWRTGNGMRYAGVWGETYKSLHEVARIPVETEPEVPGIFLNLVAGLFEAPDANGSQGTMGYYARNVRSGQSLGYRANEPFYLASTSKTAIHIMLWKDFEDVNRNRLLDFIQYTKASDSRDPWYVNEKSFPGLDSVDDFGKSFNLDRLDRGMMVVSDNATTSMIVDDPAKGIGRDRLNAWLSGVKGVGRGFGLVTAITDLDRVIMWQGQVNDFPNETSYFLIPTYAFEPWFRTFSPSVDTFGDLQDWADANNGGKIPDFSWHQGHLRYFRMGLNSAEPRAYGRLLEKYIQGEFLNDPNTLTQSLANMGTSTRLDDFLVGNQGFPEPLPPGSINAITVYGKNGGKGGTNGDGTIRHRVVNETTIIQKGPETIVMCAFTKDGVRTSTNVRQTFMPWIGYLLFLRLMPDLTDGGIANAGFSPKNVFPLGNFSVYCDVLNTGGGDAGSFKVKFYASKDTVIDETDFLIGTFVAPGLKGGIKGDVFFQTDNFPFIPKGSYYVGWIIDHPDDNEVGEWDDRLEDNRAVITGSAPGVKLEVQLPISLPPGSKVPRSGEGSSNEPHAGEPGGGPVQ